ncbi:Eukaryotic/viral aspartic protease [Phytophthora megakarya]|uniref:Eukaryotic/viral aspartic protease n=1 Tax=Phytophthora megakarya TaxID=4795 RepID=A0A225UK65_9STRA|nr:Eukaryotic/viral aspartic protease [Phytophthora megakarya]
MVPRPGSTTPDDGVEIKQEPVAGAPSIGRSSVASELKEDRPAASWSPAGTFTTDHGSSDDHEGYEEQFAVSDLKTNKNAHQGQTDEVQVQKEKEMRATESEVEPTPKTGSNDAGCQYTAEELEYALIRI